MNDAENATIIVVYGKPDCSLCEKAIAILEHLRREYGFHLEHVDITKDPGLFSRYRERIPVVLVDGREIAWGFVTTPAVRGRPESLVTEVIGSRPMVFLSVDGWTSPRRFIREEIPMA
jgi:glutaredoxin